MLASIVLASAETYVACRSDLNGRYLRAAYTTKMHDKQNNSVGVIYMEASAERVVGSARTRFILEPFDAQEHLVHIRCAYNKKYWAPQEVVGGDVSHWIIGTAHESDHEGLSTVFEMIIHEGNSFRFYHRGLQKYACIVADEGKTSLQLKDEGSIPRDGDRRSDTFTVIAVSRHKELPKYALFKGDNGRYLQPEQFVPPGTPWQTQMDPRFEQQLPWYLRFGQDNRSDPSALHTTYTNDEGQVRIKSEKNGRFWRHESDFVEAKSKEYNFNDRYTLFQVVPGKGFTALRNMGANKFCKRFSSYGKQDAWDILSSIFGGPSTPYKESCLSARAETIEETCAQLHVEEPISEREIFDKHLHIDEARVYGMSIVGTLEIVRHPNRSDYVDTIRIPFSKEKTWEGTWDTSVSMKRSEDYKSMVSIGSDINIPFINDGKLSFGVESSTSVSSEYASSHNEAGYERQQIISMEVQEFHVNPKTLLTVSVLKTQYHCDVPYSYKQRDLPFNGEEETTTHDDGIYTFTINESNVTTKSERLE